MTDAAARGGTAPASPEDPEAGQAERLRTVQALLAASYRLSGTTSTPEAADVVAEVACALTGASGAHVMLPEQLGGTVWANANALMTTARRGTLVMDMEHEAPDLQGCLASGEDLFVADALAPGSERRPLRLRHGMASVLFVPLSGVGLLVLWWNEQRSAAPAFADDWEAFTLHVTQILRRRLETTTLRDLSLTDPLTGLANRRTLLEALGALPARGALLLMDLDHFKRVNDTLGHRFGDQVLQVFGGLLREHAPGASCAARYGGEEFALVFPLQGRNTAEQVFAELRDAWHGEGLSFSAGLAEHREGASVEETVEAADRALYRAKQDGRDRLVHAADVAWTDRPSPTVRLPRPRTVASPAGLSLDDLDRALDQDLVVPYYQPVLDLRTRRVVAVEALARLTHPQSGALLPPDAFLPLAERTGRVRRLDRKVARAAIAQVAQWRRDLPGGRLAVSVNVSVDHLDDQDLAAALLHCCQQQDLPAAALSVEITETLQSVTGRGHESVVQHLHDAGVHVSLDDFGTGFSALSYLLRFPVDTVKIDKSFTAALGTSTGQQLVKGIIDLGAAMSLHVVAEGVETPEQLQWLTERGCPFAQGFLLSRPVAAHELPAAIERLEG